LYIDLLKELHTEDVKQGQNNIEKINNKVNEEQRTSWYVPYK